jgi:hypothetical protein
LGLLLAVLGAVGLAGCRCATQSGDQIFLLDGRAGSALSLDGPLDAGSVPPATSDASATSNAPDADTTGTEPPGRSLDCTATAAGCTPGGHCKAACSCVLARDISGSVSIQKCVLLATGGPPSVEVGYTITFSGCGD